MNIIEKIKDNSAPLKISMGQIYQHKYDFYIVAKKGGSAEGCLVNISNGNIWSNTSPETDIANNSDFVLFRGTIQITTDY